MVELAKGLSGDISVSKEMAKNFIVDLIGEDPEKLAELTLEELMGIIGGLLKSDKQLLEEMFINYDSESNALDPAMILAFWKLINKGLLKNTQKPFGSLTQDLWEIIKTQTALRMRDIVERGTEEQRKMAEAAQKSAKVSLSNVFRAMEYQLNQLAVANRPMLQHMTPPEKTHALDIEKQKMEQRAAITQGMRGGG